jgi:hypothetical protein
MRAGVWLSSALHNVDSGGIVTLQMNGTRINGVVSYGNSASWRVASADHDYNGDGKADALLQNADSGSLSMWLMSGLQIAQIQSLAAGTEWAVF